MIKSLRSCFVCFVKHPNCKFCLAILLVSLSYQTAKTQTISTNKQTLQKKTAVAPIPVDDPLTYVIIRSGQNTFGYIILDHNKAIIRQPSIPGLPGNKGFIKEEDAGKTARLVIYKIRNKLAPPTISKHELDSLKIKL